MKKERIFWGSVIFLLVLLSVVINMSLVYAQTSNWEYSAYNWKNSSDNFLNSSYDWENNASNWKNSEYNWGNANGLYNAQGVREGYMTINRDGTVNLFNNDGSRIAYGR
jgi:hypothetical protein